MDFSLNLALSGSPRYNAGRESHWQPFKKVIAKLLAFINMLSPLVVKFLEVASLTNECIDSRLKSNLPNVICKLDIEKAYDHVSQDFLMTIPDGMGSPRKWRR